MDEILKTENVLLNMEAETKEAALLQMSELLFKNGWISSGKKFFEEVMERETLGFTGAGNQIAIPHGISGQVNQVVIAVARLQKPVLWDTCQEGIPEEAKKVKLIVLFAVPKENTKGSETYIGSLKKVCSRLADKLTAEQLMEAEEASQAAEIFNKGREKERSRKENG